MKIYAYREDVPGLPVPWLDEEESLWRESWSRHGFEPVILRGEGLRERWPEFEEAIAKLPSINPPGYDALCERRWCAMVEAGGGFMSDLDVLNLGLTPKGLCDLMVQFDGKLKIADGHVPALVWGGRSQYLDTVHLFQNFKPNGATHVSDQEILGHSPDAFTGLSILKEYGKDGWEDCPLVHFTAARCNRPKGPTMRRVMKERTPLLITMCHGATDDTAARHKPYWDKAGVEQVFISNEADPSRFANVILPHGGHSGPASIDRMKAAFKGALETKHQEFVFGEYDCLLLDIVPRHPEPNTLLASGVFPNTDPRFTASHYPHPYLWMTRPVLQRIVRLFDRYPSDLEHGFGDRWLGLLMEREGIPFRQNPFGFSANSIDKPQLIGWARERIKEGAFMIHGVKTKEQLEAILE